MSWGYNPNRGFPGRYSPPTLPNPISGWQGQQLPAVNTAFTPSPSFPNITLPSPLSQRPLSTSYPQPGGASHQGEFVFPGIHASAGAHSSPKSVRLGPLDNTNAGQHVNVIDVDAQNAPSGREGANDREPNIGQARQPSSRKPRARQPGEAQWQKNKKQIEKLYMKDDLPLPDVIRIMERDHGFSASERMYKNKFKAWRWSKNLSQEQAVWMSEKIKQRGQKATIFYWNHQQWSEDKVMQICGRVTQTQPETGQRSASQNGQCLTEPVHYAGTPIEMKDIQYWTPLPAADTPQTPRNVSAAQPQYRETQQSHTIPRRFYLDCPPVNLDMRRTTISDLRKLLVSASQAASSQNLDEADADFRDAVSGFRQLLSPTHEETIKAGYLYASFYANSGKMDKADAVLSWMTENHREKWGSEHGRTYLHYGRMIELLRSWGLKERAENLVYKLIEGLDDNDDDFSLHLNEVSGPQHSRLLENPDDLAESFPETDDADAIRHQLDKIDLAVMTNITCLEGILQTIIGHCDEGDSAELALQACRARCALAQCFLRKGKAGDAIRVLKSGRTSLARLLEVGEEPIAHSTVEVARRFALTFFEAKDETSCKGVIDEVIVALEARLSLPEYREDKLEQHAVIDFVISTAFQFHEKSAWDNCRYWIERALALAMQRLGAKSQKALRLQKTLQMNDLHMRTSAGLSDLMGFSQGGYFTFSDHKMLSLFPRS